MGRCRSWSILGAMILGVMMLFACQPSNHDRAALLPEVAPTQRTTNNPDRTLNPEAPVPAMCYTKTEGRHNPCYVCHQVYANDGATPRMNKLDDGGIQGQYIFSDEGLRNHWDNLFTDRRDWIAQISDDAILRYIAQDNYSSLADRLQQQKWQGYVPDLRNFQLAAGAFDEHGFARDGSGWIAFNYKPLPSTFWPTNGSTDDVVIRLPAKFRSVNQQFSRAIYQINLALVEMNIKRLPVIDIAAVDENQLQIDVDGDGKLTTTLTQLKASRHYVGDAASVAVVSQQFPVGTEFLHSVRYVGVDESGAIHVPARMKELRYMQKIRELNDDDLDNRYRRERKEKVLGELPFYIDHGDRGRENGMGWLLTGFIEDYNGDLRPQNTEETFSCMGCHAAIGTTIDQTFAFARKITGAQGWGYINLRTQWDAPSITQMEGEIAQYLRLVGGGNEFRENPEMRQRWFDQNGQLKTAEVSAASVYDLITPSRERALQLNKAYTHIVRHQSFIFGRDAVIVPASNVYRDIDESSPPLNNEHRLFGWDIRLNWQTKPEQKSIAMSSN